MYSLHKDGTSLSISSRHYGHIMSTSIANTDYYLILTPKNFESKSSYIFSNVLLIIAIPKVNLSLCVGTSIKGIAIPFYKYLVLLFNEIPNTVILIYRFYLLQRSYFFFYGAFDCALWCEKLHPSSTRADSSVGRYTTRLSSRYFLMFQCKIIFLIL